MNKIKPPFNLSRVAQLAAIEALKDSNFMSRSVKHNMFWAKKIKVFLNKMNIDTNEISANFFLLGFDNCRLTANQVLKRLESKAVSYTHLTLPTKRIV